MEPDLIQLINQARRGDTEAFTFLVRRYEKLALCVAFGVLGDATAAGDVAQQAFLRVWQRLGDLHQPLRFGSWLCGIARNLAIDARRKRHPAVPLTSSPRPLHRGRWTVDPFDEINHRDQCATMAAAIRQLDEVSRIAIILRYYHDLPSKTIAEHLHITAEAVDMRLSRARKRLRLLLWGLTNDGTAAQCGQGQQRQATVALR